MEPSKKANAVCVQDLAILPSVFRITFFPQNGKDNRLSITT